MLRAPVPFGFIAIGTPAGGARCGLVYTPRVVSITLLFFAAVRELVGEGERRLIVPPHVSTIADLADHLADVIPALRGRLRSVRWARNEELVELGESLHEGDVVALIPPVAGG